jgi:hypothetical protein
MLEAMKPATEVILALVALVSIPCVLKQLREMEKQRQATMSWKLFEMHSSKQMRKARHTLYAIKDQFSSSDEYQQKYHNAKEGSVEKEQHVTIRDRLRYFHEAGLLVQKDLVDTDMLFGIVGRGLKQDLSVFEADCGVFQEGKLGSWYL